MEKYVLYFNEIDKTYLPYVGGKGANLGEMTKANFPVPQGFCITTLAYRAFVQKSEELNGLFDELEQIASDDLEQIKKLGLRIRENLNSISMPENIKSEVIDAWIATGKDKAYAVRSSATAEDLPTASFAGQQDTYLNICGIEQLLKAVQNCWASLFTDRAISYRAKNNFDHRLVYLSVVIQEMVFPEVSGIMFTADPISGMRKTVSIDASFGLGEALVSGIVNPDLYKARSGIITEKQIPKKKIAIFALPEGGTITVDVSIEKQEAQALEDHRIIELAGLGQKIEAHYSFEQDIEWAFASGRFYILQSRPITSLYPLPHVSDDKLHVFMSFGHIQMMTDVMKPLTISLFKNVIKVLKQGDTPSEDHIIFEVGGRMFADVTALLLVKPFRNRFLKVFKGMDELISSALAQVSKREDFMKQSVSRKAGFRTFRKMAPIIIPVFAKVIYNLVIKDPIDSKGEANSLIQEISRESEKKIFEVSGAERIRRIQENMGNMLPNVLAKVAVYWITGIVAAGILEKELKNKLGDKKSAHLLSQLNKSLPGNITTELGLEVGDLADIARNYPEVIDYLQKANNSSFYEELIKVNGGLKFKAELESFLSKYGMRCSGEVDITKPRWNEEPLQLIPSILSNIRTAEAGEHREKFKQGEVDADLAGKEIISQFGHFKKRRIARLVKLYRNLMGMREHHKFSLIVHLDIYKRAILQEAACLKEKGVLRNQKDVFYITIERLIELEEGNFSGNIDELIDSIKTQYQQYEKLTPPRVMTSEGEIITGKVRNIKAPEGALIGTPVSAGVVEGIARVVLRLEDAKLNPGEILVAPYTDPGWTPLFTSAIGLVTEVGGMMTHGSVIAREYGLPAVVGIDKVTEIIKDGDHILLNGTEGFVQILKK